MSPLQFETRHAAEWDRLAQQLDVLEEPRRKNKPQPELDAAALTAGYRRVCGQLALAQARAYPLHLIERLAALSQRAHRHIYREAPNNLARLQLLVCVHFP